MTWTFFEEFGPAIFAEYPAVWVCVMFLQGFGVDATGRVWVFLGAVVPDTLFLWDTTACPVRVYLPGSSVVKSPP